MLCAQPTGGRTISCHKDAVTGAEISRNLAITYAWANEKELAISQLEGVIRLPVRFFMANCVCTPGGILCGTIPRFERIVAEAQKAVALK